MREDNSAIGGYFSLEIHEENDTPLDGKIYLQSARACFNVLLANVKLEKIWLPCYICDAVVDVINELKINISYYNITKDFIPTFFPNLGKAEAFVYVNYFGICDEQIKLVLDKYPREKIILDNSQAFYSGHKGNLGTIYSPRKFFGIPDGGILVTDIPLSLPGLRDNDSSKYLNHLTGRLKSSPNENYSDYIEAEKRLKQDKKAKLMSHLTMMLLKTIDFNKAEKIRNENFEILRNAFDGINDLNIPKITKGPLCYPFLSKNTKLKDKLINSEIYVPTYWNDVIKRVAIDSVEYELVSNLVPLPCDQRYSRIEMKKIIDILLEEIQ